MNDGKKSLGQAIVLDYTLQLLKIHRVLKGTRKLEKKLSGSFW